MSNLHDCLLHLLAVVNIKAAGDPTLLKVWDNCKQRNKRLSNRNYTNDFPGFCLLYFFLPWKYFLNKNALSFLNDISSFNDYIALIAHPSFTTQTEKRTKGYQRKTRDEYMILYNDQQQINVRKEWGPDSITNRIQCESRTGNEGLMRMKTNRSSPVIRYH